MIVDDCKKVETKLKLGHAKWCHHKKIVHLVMCLQ